MKKLFFILVIFTIFLYSLYAQEEAVATEEATTTSAETTTTEGGDTNSLGILLDFAPTFDVLRGTDTNNFNKRLAGLEKIVTELREDYLFRVQYKVEKILLEYTSTNYIDTNDSRFTYTYYYDIVASTMAGDVNVGLAINKVKEAIRVYDALVPYAVVAGKVEELKAVDYEINLYAGIFYMYSASYNASARYFDTILVEKLTEDTNSLIMVNKYLAGINNILAEKQSSIFLKGYFYNNVFDRLWDIVTLDTEEGQAREDKYDLLINKYHTVIIPTSERFKGMYAPHFDRLGIVYADTEEEIVSRDPVVKLDDAPTSGTTEDTTTDAATETDATTE